MTTVRVEFFGIPRQRAGVAEATAVGGTLGEVLEDVCGRFPEFSANCVANRQLTEQCIANINGQRFTRDMQSTLREGDSVLLMSADAGG